ncbi:MAG: hypothetical protein J6A89_03285 [Clostridia bacterium]|nr:hypothetical protein [Clostridia bacterium]
MQKISLQKRSFFNSIGLDINNLPQELQIKTINMQKKLPKEDINFLNSTSLTKVEQKHFRLKNLVGTDNVNYDNKTWIEILINNEKSDGIIKQYFKNPNYYFKELRKLDQSNLNHNNSIELYEDNGKFFVKDGIGRVSLMMTKYLLEMSRAQSKEEKAIINKQYIFAANVRAVPKDRDLIYLINMLLDIYGTKLQVEKISNSEDCNYNIKYGDKIIEIKNKKELENFIKNSYLPKEYKSTEKLKNKIASLTKIGLQYKETEENEEEFLVMGKIFPNYEIFIKYYKKIQKYNLEDKLYEKLDLSNITYEQILKIIIKIVKQEECGMKEKDVKKLKAEEKNISENNETKENNIKEKISKQKVTAEKKNAKNEKEIDKTGQKINKTEKKVNKTKADNKEQDDKQNELEKEKQLANEQISSILENIELMYYKLKTEECKIMDLANGANIILNIDKINDDNVNASINPIKENAIKLRKKINNNEEISILKNLNELLKDLKKLSNEKNISIDYSEEMKNIFDSCFNKTIQKLITDSKLKKLELQKEEIEKEKCSFFSKLIGKAKLKQAKLDNINLKKQLILSESQFADKLFYYLEDGLSDLYAYIKSENDESCLIEIRAFLRNIESNFQIKKLIDQNKLNRQIQEKIEQQRNLPQLVLSREKRRLFSKAQINLMEEKNNELKRVIQITRANSLKKQNTGMIPILGNIRSTKALNKFLNNLNEINISIKYQCD